MKAYRQDEDLLSLVFTNREPKQLQNLVFERVKVPGLSDRNKYYAF